MACKTTKSRKSACKDQRGGIRNRVFFIPWEEHDWDVTGQKVTTFPETITEVFSWELKGTPNKLDETTTVSEDNGTKETLQALNLVFTKLNAETEVELDNIAAGRHIVVVPDFNGNYKAVGIDSGMTEATDVATTGGAGTDLSGYTLNLISKDSKKAPFLQAGAVAAMLALVVEDDIIEP